MKGKSPAPNKSTPLKITYHTQRSMRSPAPSQTLAKQTLTPNTVLTQTSPAMAPPPNQESSKTTKDQQLIPSMNTFKPLSDYWDEVKPVINPEALIGMPEMQDELRNIWAQMKGTQKVMTEKEGFNPFKVITEMQKQQLEQMKSGMQTPPPEH